MPKSTALLEKKLCLARETPEPIFDLSGCDIKHVPSGVYTICKVLRKECLFLQKNRLKDLDGGGKLSDLTLLRVLDLSNNQMSVLSSDIKHLVNLEMLILNDNQLKTLPDEISCLHNLKRLSLQNNKLRALPNIFGALQKLESLDLRGNEKLSKLPFSLCQAVQLKELLLDLDRDWDVPTTSVLRDGLNQTMKFLAESAGIDITHLPTEKTKATAIVTLDSNERSSLNEYLMSYDESIQDRLQEIIKRKQENLQNQLKAQEDMLLQTEQEALVQQKNKANREKLIEQLIKQQNDIDDEVLKCHKHQKETRQEFFEHLQFVENTADRVIQQVLLTNKKRNADTEFLIPKVLDGHVALQKNYQRQAVLQCMEELLQNECYLKNKFKENEELRKNIVDNIYHKEKEWENKIYDLLITNKEKQDQFLEEVSNDTNLQYAAVATLLEKTDTRSIALKTEVLMIENQLSNLTAVELQNKKLSLNEHINELSEKRSRLTDLLLDLFNQQEERRKELTSYLLEMELKQVDKSEYWLSQYKQLLDKSSSLTTDWYHCVNPELTYHLAVLGAVHCLPFLYVCDVSSIDSLKLITDFSLKEAGVTSAEDRQKILKAISLYLKGKLQTSTNHFTPTAPSLTEFPSAPELSELDSPTLSFDLLDNECVVCMCYQSSITFLPCGHLCCCINCAVLIHTCPMCRSDIVNKIQKSSFF